MSREISSDFATLKSFIEGYNLKMHFNNIEFLKILSQQHKKFYSYLTCIAELESLSKDMLLAPSLTDEQLSFLTESCSDIGSALFDMTQGAYKSSKMMLRSSIETFIKGFNLDDIPNLSQDKSLYSIFDKVKVLPFFMSESNKQLFEAIHNDYKTLCEDAHTATKINMKHITALSFFPRFEIREASELSTILMRLVSIYDTLICLKYNEYFHKMHHRNKENIIENIPKKYRPLIFGIS